MTDGAYLWCIRLAVLDGAVITWDVVAQPSREIAEGKSREHNERVARTFGGEDEDRAPLAASVERWPWSAADHATELLKAEGGTR